MQPSVSMSCDGSSSGICIGVLKPKRLVGSCSSHELVARIVSISRSFSSFAKTAVLKSRNSNHVAVFSVWERDLVESCEHPKVRLSRRLRDSLHMSLPRRNAYPLMLPFSLVDAYEKALSAVSHVVHVSWYEVSCWDCKEMKTFPSSPTSLISSSLSSPPLIQGDVKPFSLPLSTSASSALSPSVSCENFTSLPTTSCELLPRSTYMDDDKSVSSPHASSSSSSQSFHSLASAPTLDLSLGDIVHLRRIIGGHQSYLQDVLSYSCLAILKAYFPQTEGLFSYIFYRSLDGSRMAGLGVWQGVEAASAFLNAPDGAGEERYWRSMGAKTRFEIYEVAALVAE